MSNIETPSRPDDKAQPETAVAADVKQDVAEALKDGGVIPDSVNVDVKVTTPKFAKKKDADEKKGFFAEYGWIIIGVVAVVAIMIYIKKRKDQNS